MPPTRVTILSLLALFLGVCGLAFGAAEDQDYTTHPLYSTYQFSGKTAKVVDLGTQPLSVPSGVVGAALGHDRLLRRLLKEHGWNFISHSFMKGLDANFFFKRGEVDIVLAGDLPTISLAAQMDFQVIGLAQQGFSTIVCKGQRKITDLKGMRIGLPVGSSAHYALSVALENLNLSEASVTLVPMEVSEVSEALAKDKVDAFVSWEPTTANALKEHPEFSVMQRFLNNDYIYLSADLIHQNPEIADLVAAAYIRSLRWMRADRKNLMRAISWTIKDAGRMLGSPPAFSPDEMAKSTNDDLLKIAFSPIVPGKDLAENGSIRRAFAFLRNQGKIAADVPWEKIEKNFNQAFTEKILADPAKYRILTFDYDD